MRKGLLTTMAAMGLAVCGDGQAQSQRRQPVVSLEGNSANFVMVGCRALITDRTDETFRRGTCFGLVQALTVLTSCPPENVTYLQAARVVVRYIDERPARQHEDFVILAREALQQVWPCSR